MPRALSKRNIVHKNPFIHSDYWDSFLSYTMVFYLFFSICQEWYVYVYAVFPLMFLVNIFARKSSHYLLCFSGNNTGTYIVLYFMY